MNANYWKLKGLYSALSKEFINICRNRDIVIIRRRGIFPCKDNGGLDLLSEAIRNAKIDFDNLPTIEEEYLNKWTTGMK